MRRYLVSEIRRGILSRDFWLAVAIFLIAGFVNYYSNISSAGLSHVGGLTTFIHSTIMGYSIFSYIAPFIAGFPMGGDYITRFTGGYINQELLRIEKKTYVKTKIISIAIVGAMVFVISCIIFLVICLIMDSSISIRLLPMRYVSAYKHIYVRSLLLYCIMIILNSALFGASYSLLTLGVSSWCPNRILTLAIVSVFYIGTGFLNGFNLFGIPILPCAAFVMLVSGGAAIKDHILVSVIGIVLFILGFRKDNVL